MTRLVTLLGYAAVAVCAVVLEAAARRSPRWPRLGDILDAVVRHWPSRVVLLAGWLWLGWHLFARVGWR